MKRRLVTLLLTLVAVLAVPATVMAKPKVVIVTSPGFWPVCAVVTGSKDVAVANRPVGTQFNKTLVCYGKKGRFQEIMHMRRPPNVRHGQIVPGSRNWRKGHIPGSRHQIFTMSRAVWFLQIGSTPHYQLARVKMFITAGHPGHPAPFVDYGNGHRAT